MNPPRTSLPSTHAAASDPTTAITAHQTPPKHPRQQPKRQPQRQQQQGQQQQQKPGSDPRHMAIALHHAHRIQAQKDTEALILDRILLLATFPPSSSPAADPAAPSPDDARAFKSALIPFQPVDYDNLIQERNIEGLCGYGLCPREHRKEDDGPGGGFRIRYGSKGSGPGGRGREMNIVPREKLEMWCSDECAERAMYIRVQLGEEPVWERRGDAQTNLVLLEEGRGLKSQQKDKGKSSSAVGQVTEQLGDLQIQPGESSEKDGAHSRELALERGDSSSSAFQAGRVAVRIQEKEDIAQVLPPQLRPEDAQGGSIEGYVPKPE